MNRDYDSLIKSYRTYLTLSPNDDIYGQDVTVGELVDFINDLADGKIVNVKLGGD